MAALEQPPPPNEPSMAEPTNHLDPERNSTAESSISALVAEAEQVAAGIASMITGTYTPHRRTRGDGQ